MKQFQDRTVLITGGANGIGAALAVGFAAEGAKIAVTDVALERSEEIAARIRAGGGQAIALTLDVTDPRAWTAAATETEARLGPIDVLCSNAGVLGSMLPLTEIPPAYLQWLMNINVMGAVHAVQAIAPKMIARRSG